MKTQSPDTHPSTPAELAAEERPSVVQDVLGQRLISSAAVSAGVRLVAPALAGGAVVGVSRFVHSFLHHKTEIQNRVNFGDTKCTKYLICTTASCVVTGFMCSWWGYV